MVIHQDKCFRIRNIKEISCYCFHFDITSFSCLSNVSLSLVQKKIAKFNIDQIRFFNQLNNFEKFTILELKQSDREKAMLMSKKYFEFFRKLKPNQRIIFFQNNPKTAFTVFSTLNETDWQTILFLSISDLKRFILERIKQLPFM